MICGFFSVKLLLEYEPEMIEEAVLEEERRKALEEMRERREKED